MRRPKGIKTKKSVAKRFKITASGKVLRASAGKRHLAQTKSPKRRRNLAAPPRYIRLMCIASRKIYRSATKFLNSTTNFQ